ncbi:MAG TPA: PPOX class F420-dependent oxidoreductase [Streptosporangiaceae bacterium]|nr:PPOX class F420-dependent oxidoreductase [Streptosporangiaceae bacterium]
MSAERARQFLRAHHRAVLATTRSDGRPQMSPVVCAVDDEGRVLISTRETAVKTRNLRRDPYASICAFTDRFFGHWLQAEGEAEVISLPDAMDLLVEYYRLVSGEHPDWSDYRAAMVRDRRVMIRVTLSRTGPTISG